jgi:hypothetical protein
LPALAKPSTPPPSPWLRRLRNVRGCRRELARVYGMARDGVMDWGDASRAGQILLILVKMIEGFDIEQRLDRLERAIADQPIHPNGGGNNRHWGARP